MAIQAVDTFLLKLAEQDVDALGRFCTQHTLRPFVVHLAAWLLIIQKYDNIEEPTFKYQKELPNGKSGTRTCQRLIDRTEKVIDFLHDLQSAFEVSSEGEERGFGTRPLGTLSNTFLADDAGSLHPSSVSVKAGRNRHDSGQVRYRRACDRRVLTDSLRFLVRRENLHKTIEHPLRIHFGRGY